MAKVIALAVVLLLGSANMSAQSVRRDGLPKFVGREVTITDPGTQDPDGFYPKGPATVCVEGPPQRQCYTAPQEFGNGAAVSVVQVRNDMPALFFSADSGGVSGWSIHFALLRPGMRNDLEDLLNVSASNQSRYAFWKEASISDAQIFGTADFVWGPDEAHYSDHRYIISAYVLRRQSLIGDTRYFLEDQYMTVRKYNYEKDDILGAEMQEILARLKRVKDEQARSN